MGYNSAEGRAEYIAVAAQTDFTFVFKIYKDEDLKIYLTPVGDYPNDADDLLVLGTDYTAVVNGDNGGTFTLVVPATAGDTVTAVRELEQIRDIEYQENGELRPQILNADQNYQTYLIQDLNTKFEKVVRLPDGSQGASGELPNPVPDSYLIWDSDGEKLINDITIPAAVATSAANALEAKGYRDEAGAHASAASGSASQASGFANDAQLRVWDAEAERLTADSYATEDVNVPVKIYTSNGDGTFTATNTSPIEYSSKHYSIIGGGGGGLDYPVVTGDLTPDEESDVDYTITNFGSDFIYVITVSGGSYVLNAGVITWTIPAFAEGAAQSMTVLATKVGYIDSPTTSVDVIVQQVPVIADQALIYDAASMSEFTEFAHTELVSTDTILSSKTIDTTSIIATAGVDTFDTTTEIVDGDVISVDGTDMVADGVTYLDPNYTVDTTTVTAGGTPTSAYINERRALSNVVTQDGAETDFVGLGSDAGSFVPFEAQFEFSDISVDSTIDVLNTTTKIVDGDNLVIVKDDDSINEVVASGVTTSISLTIGSDATLNDLEVTNTSSSFTEHSIYSNLKISAGNVYWEVVIGVNSEGSINHDFNVGIALDNTRQENYLGINATEYSYNISAKKTNNDVAVSYGATYTTGDIIGVRYEYATGELEFYKNGVSQGVAYILAADTEMYAAAFMYSDTNSLEFVMSNTTYLPSGCAELGSSAYSMPYIGMTATARAYAVDAKPSFKFGGDFQEAVKSGDSYIETASVLSTTRTYDQLLATSSSRELRTKCKFKSDNDKLIDLRATVLKAV